MMISLMVAYAQNRVIGFEGDMPWHMPADLLHFKKMTLNKPIIMGRKTFETLPGPLPKRRNIIVTRNENYKACGADVFLSLDSAIGSCSDDEVIIVGGAQIYKHALAVVDRMYITEIDAPVTGDTFFPKWDKSLWHETARESHKADERHAYDYDFVQWDRDAL
jgi:dihydrofolate reductase